MCAGNNSSEKEKIMSDEKNVAEINRKKKAGALIVSLVISIPLIAFLSFLFFVIFKAGTIAVLPILLIYVLSILCTLIGTVVVLVQRFKEIDKGEENEASKY